MTAYITPQLVFKALDANGGPLAGGQLFTYQSGTNILLATFTDATGLTAAPNPIILDANGEWPLWIGPTPYRFNLLDANGNQMPNYPVDAVSSIPPPNATQPKYTAQTSYGIGDVVQNNAGNSTYVSLINGNTSDPNAGAFNLTASAASGTLNVTATTQVLGVGTTIAGNGSLSLPAGTAITGLGTGRGGVGTYLINYSGTITSSTYNLNGFNWDLYSLNTNGFFEVLGDTSSPTHGAGLVGYKAPYTGAVPRTQAAKNSDTVSVLDFGAVGDGVHDDTAAVQAAINSGAGCILIPGWCAVTQLDLTTHGTKNRSLITIKGVGHRTSGFIALAIGANNPILDLTGSAYISLESFTIDASSCPSGWIGILLARPNSASCGNHTLRDITLKGYFGCAGIATISSENNNYDNVVIENWSTGVAGAGSIAFLCADVPGSTGVTSYFNPIIAPVGGNTYHCFNHCQFYHYYFVSGNLAMSFINAQNIHIKRHYVNETATNVIQFSNCSTITADIDVEGTYTNAIAFIGTNSYMDFTGVTSTCTGATFYGADSSVIQFSRFGQNTYGFYAINADTIQFCEVDCKSNAIQARTLSQGNFYRQVYNESGLTLPIASNDVIQIGAAGTTPNSGLSFAFLANNVYNTAVELDNLDRGYAQHVLVSTTVAASTKITGFSKGRIGEILILTYITPAIPLTIANASSSSLSANRINTGTGADLVFSAQSQYIELIFIWTAGGWNLVSGSQGHNVQDERLPGIAVNTNATTTIQVTGRYTYFSANSSAAGLTVQMPAHEDGKICTVVFANAASTPVYWGSIGGGTVIGGPSPIVANTPYSFVWVAASSQWLPYK